MADPTITDLILQDHRIAYVTTDANLRIVETGGFLAVFGEDHEAKPGDWLLDLSPELVGSESVLFDIMNGDLPRFQLEHINRSTADGSTTYMSVTVLPYHSSRGDTRLLILAADTSEQGFSEQKLTQQRNELRLLRRNLAEANEQLDYLLRRYVPAEVADALKEQRLLPRLGGQMRETSVLFADVRGYTSISEKLSPTQTMEVLNECLGIASGAIAEAGGTITDFIGDAVMALFNAPDDQPDHAQRAVRAGLVLQQRVTAHECRISPDSPTVSFGVGINTGDALVGNIGTLWRYHYTAIGDTVNVAQRIADAARAGEVLIGPSTFNQLQGQVAATPLAPIHFKGKSHPVTVHRLDPLSKENDQSP
jgi:adenylate cyclase